MNASTVAAGTPISGTFSYDSQIFNVNSGNATGWQYSAIESSNPVVIAATVGGSTFQVSGTIQSELDRLVKRSGSLRFKNLTR